VKTNKPTPPQQPRKLALLHLTKHAISVAITSVQTHLPVLHRHCFIRTSLRPHILINHTQTQYPIRITSHRTRRCTLTQVNRLTTPPMHILTFSLSRGALQGPRFRASSSQVLMSRTHCLASVQSGRIPRWVDSRRQLKDHRIAAKQVAHRGRKYHCMFLQIITADRDNTVLTIQRSSP
jgi:hypothetical protein